MCSTCRSLRVTWEQVEVGQPMLAVPDYGSTGGEKDAGRIISVNHRRDSVRKQLVSFLLV